MQLRDGVFEQYNGFLLDTENILCAASTSKDRVVLPYTGDLPSQFTDCTTPEIRILVKPGDVRVQLTARQNSRKIMAIVDADSAELCSVLDKFFERVGNGSTGLSPFWEGVWFAHYADWKSALRKTAA
ncbi:hypothetical protein D5272_01820 [bacterium D16-76]|nr:hypothetical protein [bacterium D16-76]